MSASNWKEALANVYKVHGDFTKTKVPKVSWSDIKVFKKNGK